MRAASILMSFAMLDGALVAVGVLVPEGAADTEALRRPLLAILVITGIGLVALAVLSWLGRRLARLRGEASRAVGGLLVGGAYAAAILGCLAWAALWFSPIHALVALAGLACAGLLLFQLWAGDEWERGLRGNR
jgi:protein-S-isoprenylcysteine O-methyltransferase Ste14